jgi:hypothetical protein
MKIASFTRTLSFSRTILLLFFAIEALVVHASAPMVPATPVSIPMQKTTTDFFVITVLPG